MSLHKINNITVKCPINNQPIFSRDLLHAISELPVSYAYHKWSFSLLKVQHLFKSGAYFNYG